MIVLTRNLEGNVFETKFCDEKNQPAVSFQAIHDNQGSEYKSSIRADPWTNTPLFFIFIRITISVCGQSSTM
jgi:hypothetical protein